MKNIITDLRRRWRLQSEANESRRATKDAVLADPVFRRGLDELAASLGLAPAAAVESASRYLDEVVSVHSPAIPDFNLVLSRIADKRSFDGVLQYDAGLVERLRTLNETNAMVMLTAHRSYLDFVVRVPFSRRGFPREFRFAGANIDFWPMGGIGRNTGIIFIRRGFRDPLYTFVLRHYVRWLTERRANFLWALEGGRTRTGKLVPPKAGLLAYVADAYVSGQAADVMLVPATVVYEYLDEVYEYARYGRGAAKGAESLLFVFRMVRAQRRVPPQARIHIGIGEPVSLGQFLDRDAENVSATELSAGVTRAATEVCRRIDAVTPITSIALVLLPLLERDGVQLTVDELVAAIAPIVGYIVANGLPAAEPEIGADASVRRALDLLVTQGLVDIVGSSPAAVHYAVAPGRHIEAAYYRNAIVHFFAIASIVEIALIRSASAPDGARVAAFWAEVQRLRELLDDEFFFPEGDAFGDAVGNDLTDRAEDWQASLETEGGAKVVLERLGPFFAPVALAPFLEAYQVVADELQGQGAAPVVDDHGFKLACLVRADAELARGGIRRPDAASLNMFDTPLKAAHVRGLVREPSIDGRLRFTASIEQSLEAIAALEVIGGNAKRLQR